MTTDDIYKQLEVLGRNIAKIREALECPDSMGVLECAALRTSEAVVYKRQLEETRAHLGGKVASVPDAVLALVEAMKPVEAFLDAFDHCHVCQGQLALDDLGPVHCEDCSGDCDDHDEPNCIPIYILHGNARAALKRSKA